MAKPDCDDGWYKKSIELEAALDFADFTKIARTILRYGFCQIFGQGRRPKFIKLGCSEVAQRIGKDRQQVFRAFDELVVSGVLAPVGNKPDTYRFVKNYEMWSKVRRRPGGFEASEEPRLTRVEIKDCILAPGYSRSFELPTNADECVSHLDDTLQDPNESLSSKRTTKRHPNGLQVVSHLDDKTSSKRTTKQAPPKNPLLGSEIRVEENKNKNIADESGEARKKPDAIADLIAWLPSVTDKPNVLKNLKLKAPLLAEKVARRRPEFAAVAAEWVKDVLTKACDKDNPITYCEAILDGWIEKGGRPGVELPGPERPQSNRNEPKSTPNLPTESAARAARASRDSAEAVHSSRKARWEALGDDDRLAVESQFDGDNPKPGGLPPGIWATTRLLGCMELMDKLRTHHSEAS